MVYNLALCSVETLYLLVCLEGPVILDAGVTEVADLAQHRVHEGGAKVLSVCGRLHAKRVSQVFS